MVQGKIPPHLAEVRIPSALPKQCVRVCSVDCYRQIKKKNTEVMLIVLVDMCPILMLSLLIVMLSAG